jgi:hypothetical protein
MHTLNAGRFQHDMSAFSARTINERAIIHFCTFLCFSRISNVSVTEGCTAMEGEFFINLLLCQATLSFATSERNPRWTFLLSDASIFCAMVGK